MGMKLDEAITRYKSNAEYERTHGNLQGCLEFRQLAKWLEELRAYRNMYHKEHKDDCLRAESDIEVRKPCINYEDGCEEWAGCPCVHYKGRK